ncbi:hypothetical protein C2W62_11615 [Candidatus Entotheonella serta]|nr:hypothetical protein C2W62_11615 [Candidatus Entotheonella serta]
MTDDELACLLDRIVVYGTIGRERFDLAELVDLLNEHGVTPSGQAIDRTLARLELGFVLGRDDNGHYFYRVPLFRELVSKDAPAVKFQIEVESWKARV